VDKLELWRRVVALPLDLAEMFLEDLDATIEGRLSVLELEASNRCD